MKDLKDLPSGLEVRSDIKKNIGGVFLLIGFVFAFCGDIPDDTLSWQFYLLTGVSLLLMVIGSKMLGILDPMKFRKNGKPF